MPYVPENTPVNDISSLPAAVSKVFNIPTGGQVATPVQPRQRSGLENIAGFLGDFLTSRMRMGTPYRDAREAEKLNAARLADEQLGDGLYANVGGLDAKLGATLAQQAEVNKRLAANTASQDELRDSRIAAERRIRSTSVLTRAANMFNTALARAKTPEEREAAYSNLYSLRKHSKELADPELAAEFDSRYPEKFDPDIVAASIGEFTPVTAQWAAERASKAAAVREADIEADNERGDRNLYNTISNTSADNERANQALKDRNANLDAGRKATAARQAERLQAAAERQATRLRAQAGAAAQKTAAKPRPTADDLQRLRADPGLRDKFDARFGLGASRKVLGV